MTDGLPAFWCKPSESYGAYIHPGGEVSLNVAGSGVSSYFEPLFNPPMVFELRSDGSGWLENTDEHFARDRIPAG
jgi:hypothetical protein